MAYVEVVYPFTILDVGIGIAACERGTDARTAGEEDIVLIFKTHKIRGDSIQRGKFEFFCGL